MISLNGVAIPHYTLDQFRWAEKRIPPAELNLWDASFGRQGVNLMLPPRVHRPRARIGVLHWPQGASRWASFNAIITEDQLLQIDPQYPGVASTYVSGSSADTLCNVRDWTLVLDENNPGNKITTVLHPLSPVPLQDIAGKLKYYIVSLVDERFYWWWRAGQMSIREGLTTWTEVFTNISTILEISPTIDFIDPAFDRPSRLMAFDFLPAPLMLDAAALAVGMRVVRLFDGTVEVQGPENAKAFYDTAVAAWDAQRLAGGQSAQSHLVWDVPEKVCVSFNKVNAGNIIAGQYGVTIDLNDTGIAEFFRVGGRCGTLPVFAQPLAAVAADGSGTPTNLATLQGYAKKWAEKYYRWLLRRPNIQYAGIVPFAFNGLVDAIEAHHHSEPVQLDPLRNPGAHRVTTRLLPVPWDWKETGAPAGASSTGDVSFLARVTNKTYPAFGYIEYNFDRVTDTDDPTAITWTDATQDPSFAYEINNIDVPVSSLGGLYSGAPDDHPTIVRIHTGPGGNLLFDSQPRWSFVRKIADADADGYFAAQLIRFDQVSNSFKVVESCYLLDVNAAAIG